MINKDLIQPTILYENSTGTSGNAVCSDTISNYNYIEVYGKDNDGRSVYTKVPTSMINFSMMGAVVYSSSACYAYVAIFSISGSTITNVKSGIYGTTIETGNFIFITKVVGYK